MDVDKRLDEQWPAIVADPEAWARSVAWALPLEHPGKAIVALAMRQGMTAVEGQALFDRLFEEWKRVLAAPYDRQHGTGCFTNNTS